MHTENKPEQNLASRWKRLGAVLIDGFAAMLLSWPYMSHRGVLEVAAESGAIPLDMMLELALYGWVVFFVLHAYLLGTYGQTLGKKLLGIYIVTPEGHKPDLWAIILKRYAPVAFVAYIPVLGSILPTIDALFIFRSDKRCVHDMIAGTKVVDSPPLQV